MADAVRIIEHKKIMVNFDVMGTLRSNKIIVIIIGRYYHYYQCCCFLSKGTWLSRWIHSTK